jgi:hypothetical protein
MQHFTIYLFISVRHATCFRRFFRPSSGAQNCTYRVRYWSDKYLTLYVQFWAPDDGRKNHLKHVQSLTEINKLWNIASCWLYCANFDITLAISATYILVLARGMVSVPGHATMPLDDWWSMFWDGTTVWTSRFIKLHTTSLNKGYRFPSDKVPHFRATDTPNCTTVHA